MKNNTGSVTITDGTDSVLFKVDSLRNEFVDTTGRKVASRVMGVFYDPDSTKYKHYMSIRVDTTKWGQSKIAKDRRAVFNNAAGKLAIAKEVAPTSYYADNSWQSFSENSVAVTTQANSTNLMRAFPFLVRGTVVIDSLRYEISTGATGAATVAIYNDSTASFPASSNYPMTQLILGGRDTTSAAVKTISNTASPDTLTPGLYWIVYAGGNGGTATYRAIALAGSPNILGYNPALGSNNQYTHWEVSRTYDQFLPNPFTAGGTLTTNIIRPEVLMRVKRITP